MQKVETLIISIVNCNISFQSKIECSLRHKNQDSQIKSDILHITKKFKAIGRFKR